jgi:uncharacterized repeat protein (TIGR03803 family)
MTAIALPAQTLTTLYSFDSTAGAYPSRGLVQAANGDFYGTTYGGGANGGGAVFKITPSGTLTTLYSFDGADGGLPSGGLVQAANGDFYGTTYDGGANCSPYGCGTIFKITLSGMLTMLHSFDGADGAYPYAGLVQATNGDLYGTTYDGGANCLPDGCGTIFRITPSGTLTTLYTFCSQTGCADGQNPYAGLAQATNGDFYGTTYAGGANCPAGGCGTIFKITPSGSLTTLYTFCSQTGCADGQNPEGRLVQATNGDFYGTTYAGGANCPPNGCGTIFKITPSGMLTTLYSFCSQSGCSDGELPIAGLVQATDGSFYGTTAYGGANEGGGGSSAGTVFKITPMGALTTLYNFCSQSACVDGSYPVAALVQATNGDFYGTTFFGGTSATCYLGCGTVFDLSVGLGPFVVTQPTSGKVGMPVKILGTNLTGATSVTFNGTAAVFQVLSSSEIKASVPAGATTGTVEVVIPRGALSSNVTFRVLP